jgi:hypothetical protein
MNNWTNQIPGQFYKYGEAGLPQTFYVAPNGIDLPGTSGNINDPFLSYEYAVTRVQTFGDTIFLRNGTYTVDTTVEVAPGINITGESRAGVILTTTNNAVGHRIISLFSADGIENDTGFHKISNLTIDCNMVGYRGVHVWLRNNIEIFNCDILNCTNSGIVFDGSIGGGSPAIWSLNNKVHDCIIDNCADYVAHGGCFVFGGQDGFELYNNRITQSGRGAGLNGYPITWVSSGYVRHTKIHHNYIYKEFDSPATFPICYEGWTDMETEFYNNEVVDGSIDCVNYELTLPGYKYQYYVHDNYIHKTVIDPANVPGWAIVIEGIGSDCFITRNLIENFPIGIGVTKNIVLVPGTSVRNNYIWNNIIHNYGNMLNLSGGGISISGGQVTTQNEKLFIFNNIIYQDAASNHGNYAIHIWNTECQITDVFIFNNIICRGRSRWLYTQATAGAGTIKRFVVSKNILFDNGNLNVENLALVPTNYYVSDNTIGDPLFVDPANGDFHLQAGSPAIETGLNFNFMNDLIKTGYSDYEGTQRTDPPNCGIY